MPVIVKSALVTFSASRMFDLVAKMEDYPKFLPWCAATEVLSHEDDWICGRMEVARVGIHQRVRDLVEHPTEGLVDELAGKLEVERELHLTGIPAQGLKGPGPLELAEGSIHQAQLNPLSGNHSIAGGEGLVDAFCKRAEEIYRD